MTIASLTTTPATPTPAPKTTASAAPGTAATSDIPPTSQAQDPAAVLQTAVAAAMQDAAARQDGLAVLMANLLQVSGKLPPALQKALDELVALHMPTDTPPDSTDVQQAVRSSGLFTEAKLASGAPPADLSSDVKTVLLRLNDAAQKWLANAASETAAPHDPSAVAPPKTEDANAVQTASARPADSDARTPRGTAQTGGTVARNLVQAAASAIAQTRTAPQTPPLADARPALNAPPNPKNATPAATPSPAPAVVDSVNLPKDVKALLVLLARAADVWMARPQAAQTAPASALANSATAEAASPSDGRTPVAPRAAATASTTSSVRGAQTLTPAQDRPLPSAVPTSAAAMPKTASTPATAVPTASTAPEADPVALSATMQTIGRLTQAMLSAGADRAEVPANLKAVLFLLNRTASDWTTPSATPATPQSTTASQSTAVQQPATAPQSTTAQPADRPLPVAKSSAPAPDTAKAASQPAASQTATPQSTTPQSTAPQTTALPQQAAASQPATATPPVQLPADTEQPAAGTPRPNEQPASRTTPDANLARTPAPPSAPQPSAAIPNDLKTVLSLVTKLAEAWFSQDGAANDQPATQRPSIPSVPPPVAGAPGKAQAAAQASLPEHADPLAIAGKLASGSDAAVARQTLLQIASLPDGTQQPGRTSDARWMMDIPVMTPQGSAVAQLTIERDGSNASADAPLPVWRVQFAIDIEPLGPVRANLALSGGRTWVTISADRPASLEKLRADASWLSDALQATDLTADIAFQSGRAPARKNPRSRLVDHAL